VVLDFGGAIDMLLPGCSPDLPALVLWANGIRYENGHEPEAPARLLCDEAEVNVDR
jgi:hypothetical protein